MRTFYLKKYIETVAKEEELKRLIQNNHNLAEMYQKNLKQYYEGCNHEVVICLGKKDKYSENNGYAVCLHCDKEFCLETKDKDEDFSINSVIRVDDLLPEDMLITYVAGENVVISRAKAMLQKLSLSQEVIDSEDLRQNILEDLVYLSDELELAPRSRKRILSEGNKKC